MSEDYQLLQVEERINGILNDETLRYVGGSHLLNLLQPVRAQLLDTFASTTFWLQSKCKNNQRLENNKLCSDKCSDGSVVHNFTGSEVPRELTEFL